MPPSAGSSESNSSSSVPDSASETAAARPDSHFSDDTTICHGGVSIGPFTDAIPHAKGGLGEVFCATDLDLHRKVAIKRLQPQRLAEESSLRRFLVEAEVTARLEHPGVVPVYALYRNAEGGPAYTMRFVEGPTYADAIKNYHASRANPLLFRQLLQSFLQICQTVAFAHSRGVIHRDLKPQNVLLGKFGVTLVVDWGLAKVIGRSEEMRSSSSVENTLMPQSAGSVDGETLLGSAVGTPAYMSPEQAAGRWDVIDQRSDVYGLGAVMYYLLTGKPPIDKGNWPEIQQKIQRGLILSPRQIRSGIPGALDAICRMAMAVDPDDRYASAALLAADIEHWFADEPVTAFREPVSTQSLRWMRNHRTTVTAFAVLVVAALVSTSVGLLLLKLKNQEIAGERNEAKVQRILAEQNFQEARRSVDEYFVTVSEGPLLAQPGTQQLRKQLLESALKYYQTFVERRVEDSALAEELALAFFRVGSINREVGSRDAAIQAFQKAISLYEKLMQLHPDRHELLNQIAKAYRLIGVVHWGDSNLTAGHAANGKAIEYGELLCNSHPTITEYKNDLAWAYTNGGGFESSMGHKILGQKLYLKSIAMWEDLVEMSPSSLEYSNGLARTKSNIGEEYFLDGQLDKALQLSQEAARLHAKLMTEHDRDQRLRFEAVLSLNNVAELLRVMGRDDESEKEFSHALDIARPLTRDNPVAVEYQERFALAANNYGMQLLKLKRTRESLEIFDEVLAIVHKCPEFGSDNALFAETYRGIASAQRTLNNRSEALSSSKIAVEIGEKNPGEQPYSAFDLACSLALCSSLVGDEENSLSELQLAEKAHILDRSMVALTDAVNRGWHNLRCIQEEFDLSALEDRDDYKALVQHLTKLVKEQSN